MGQMEGENCQICEEMNAAMHGGQWSRAPLPLKRFVFKVKWVMIERWCFPGESDWGLGVPARAEAVLGALRGVVDFYTGRYRSGPRRDIDVNLVNRPSSCAPASAGCGGPAFPMDRRLRRRTAFISALD